MAGPRRNYLLAGVLAVVGLLVFGGNAALADLECQVFCPNFDPGVPFNVTVKAYNNSNQNVSFNKVAIAYLNPDLTVKGPYVKAIARTVAPNSAVTFTVPLTIVTTQPGGTLTPVAVTLWNNYVTAGYQRGGGAGAAQRKQ